MSNTGSYSDSNSDLPAFFPTIRGSMSNTDSNSDSNSDLPAFFPTISRSMSNTDSDSDSDSNFDLPQDLINEILLRTDSKILLRCKLVCRSWNALISDPKFFAKHLGTTQSQNVETQSHNDRILFIRRHPHTRKIVISLLSSDNPFEYQDLPYDATFPDNTAEGRDLYAYSIVLCCNHLLFLQPYRKTKMILWDPKETNFKILPECGIHVNSPYEPVFYDIGFGFDSVLDDYKVVRMIAFGAGVRLVEVEVYSQRANSWTTFDAVPPVDLLSARLLVGTIYIDGLFYWYASRPGDLLLLSFDMSRESFNFTPLPIPYVGLLAYDKSFFSLTDRPAMVHRFIGSRFDVWVLLEHCVKKSWVRLYSIPYRQDIRFIVGSWSSRELFVESDDGELWLYDAITGEIKKLNIRGYICTLEIDKYRDSE